MIAFNFKLAVPFLFAGIVYQILAGRVEVKTLKNKSTAVSKPALLTGAENKVEKDDGEAILKMVVAHKAATESERALNGAAGVAPFAPLPFNFKLMQFNILADGLASDGFMMPRESDNETVFFERVKDTIGLIRAAKEPLKGKKLTEKRVSIAAEQYKTKAGKVFLTDAERELEEANEQRIVAWSVRGPKIVKLIKESGADVVTLQEMDKYAYFAKELAEFGYTSVKHGQSPTTYADTGMQKMRVQAISDAKAAKADKAATYLDQKSELEAAGVAYAPNLNSNARKFARMKFETPPEAGSASDPDDQGVAIFWNTTTFKMVGQPEMTVIGAKKDSLAMKVVLTHVPTNEPVTVVTTHLSSGLPKEVKRHEELRDMGHLLQSKDSALVFAGDLNSEIWFEGSKDDTTCFDMITGTGSVEVGKKEFTKWDMNSVWGSSEYLKTKEAPPTVFKMRGPGSGQPHKMGIFALETIDHIFTKDGRKGSIKLVSGSVNVLGSSMPAMTNKELKDDRKAVKNAGKVEEGSKEYVALKKLLWNMLPTPANPSDHFAVLAKFEISGTTGTTEGEGSTEGEGTTEGEGK